MSEDTSVRLLGGIEAGGTKINVAVADYLGQACATLTLTLSVGRIVIGGGVSQAPGFHAAIAARMRYWLGGYLTDAEVLSDSFVVRPGLGDPAGLVGAMLVGQQVTSCAPGHP